MKNKITKIIWLFVIGSFIGYLIETAVVIYQGNYEVRKRLIYGAFIPVYGLGAIVYYLVLSNIKLNKENKIKNIIIVFLITLIVGGVTEYICSYVQEMCFGTVSWDYSYLPFDIQGRTSLKHSTFWGLLGVTYYLLVMPWVEKADRIIDKKVTKVLTIMVSIFLIFDILISILACHRNYERRQNIEPSGKFEKFLDEHYPDEHLDKIYVNLREK